MQSFNKNDIIYTLKEDGLMYNKVYMPRFYKVIKITGEKIFVKPIYAQMSTVSIAPHEPMQDKIVTKQATPIDMEVTNNSIQERYGILPGKKSFYVEMKGDFLNAKRLKKSKYGVNFKKFDKDPITWKDTIETFPR
jgi:hypothetical protein